MKIGLRLVTAYFKGKPAEQMEDERNEDMNERECKIYMKGLIK